MSPTFTVEQIDQAIVTQHGWTCGGCYWTVWHRERRALTDAAAHHLATCTADWWPYESEDD
ncbi:MAG: hypothetical protein J2O39_00230 [Acidimicrobiales bacterium]|nr:hypothetical protein [Acidimicrobiales bacterium]